MTHQRAASTLADVGLGASAHVIGYRESAPVRRLTQMGFVPGRTVTAVRTAPLGDPIEYSVVGSRVAMRRSDAEMILVERPSSAPRSPS